MFKHLLVPTDGSPLSQAAVIRAISFAREAGARITFFCAEQPFPSFYYGFDAIFDAHAPARFHEYVDQITDDILDAAVKLAREAGVECDKVALTCDEPYEGIIKAADENSCDLILMASHGRRGVSGLLIAGETRKVLTYSKIPVLVHR